MNRRTKPSKTYRGGVAGGADGRLEGAVELTASQLRELLRAIDADAAWKGPTIPQEFDNLAAKIWEQQGMPAPCGPLTMIVHERGPVVLARRQPNDAAQAEAAPAADRVEPHVGQDGVDMCGCKPFCETHGRDEIAVDAYDFGGEGCAECAAHGFSGEMCWPDPYGCHIGKPEANRWERQFMCWWHRFVHRWFCWRHERTNADLRGRT